MKNEHDPLETDAKPKMLFNSDGFEFLIKFVTGLFTIIGTVLLVMLKIIGTLCASTSKYNESNEDNINEVNNTNNFVPLNPMKTNEENEFDGTGYYK